MKGKIITFCLHETLFGIDITKVKEVGRETRYTYVPGAQPCIAGLMNMRGQVVTLFDITQVMGLDCSGVKGSSYIILKNNRGSGGYAGFLVDRIGDVIDIQDSYSSPLPKNMDYPFERYIKEIVQFKDILAAVVDEDSILNECLAVKYIQSERQERK